MTENYTNNDHQGMNNDQNDSIAPAEVADHTQSQFQIPEAAKINEPAFSEASEAVSEIANAASENNITQTEAAVIVSEDAPAE